MGTDFARTAIEAFAERLRGQVDMTVLGLRARGLAPGEPYGMHLEVAAVAEAAGAGPAHLAGFSAGATVALAAALALGDAVRSVALLEPAFIGDDDWDPAEARWRAAIGSLGAASTAREVEAFRAMLMAPGATPPPSRGPPAWDFRDDLLGSMLSAHTGFESSDLAAIRAPVLLIRGGRSTPRFGVVARRLMAVCPRASEHVFSTLHHFAPPYREQPEELAGLLLDLWGAA
ncbi:MAG TPA: alpha/beta fold hydrolase [Gaiellales bacterium]|nr:alpha/beta fold hydrolase [Gaiellales bacterium]